jgi:hypothetical protein
MTFYEFINDYFVNISPEKAFRIDMTMHRQADSASTFDGALTINEVMCIEEDDWNITFIFFNKSGKPCWAPMPLCDITGGLFITSDWGFSDPDGNNWMNISEYGRTWVAINHQLYNQETGWPQMNALAARLWAKTHDTPMIGEI